MRGGRCASREAQHRSARARCPLHAARSRGYTLRNQSQVLERSIRAVRCAGGVRGNAAQTGEHIRHAPTRREISFGRAPCAARGCARQQHRAARPTGIHADRSGGTCREIRRGGTRRRIKGRTLRDHGGTRCRFLRPPARVPVAAGRLTWHAPRCPLHAAKSGGTCRGINHTVCSETFTASNGAGGAQQPLLDVARVHGP